MKTLALAAAGALIVSSAALAQQPTSQEGLMTSIPANSRTVTDWYKQNVYDQNNQKLGEIMDLLVNQSGQIEAAMVGVGGFHRGIRYTLRKGIERAQYRAVIHPDGVEMPSNRMSGSLEDAAIEARGFKDSWRK